ncbi:hypothetical protein JHK86_009037 [Glycine max]|nr:hypothetical protein JHK86_009037 [Glycine max]
MSCSHKKNGMFSAGFYVVGQNAYSFAVWFSEPYGQTRNATVVWMANRDQPVNDKDSKISLLRNGNLALNDVDESLVWYTNTASLSSSVHTLLPQQVFTRHSKLVSSRSETNMSSGFYALFFDNDNIFRLLYDGPEVFGLYWPDPWLASWNAG